MEPERVSPPPSTIQPSRPPPPPPLPRQPEGTTANVTDAQGRRNLSFSWSLSSSATSSFNSLADSFKKNDISSDIESQQPMSMSSREDQLKMSTSGSWSSRRSQMSGREYGGGGGYDPNRIPSSIFSKPSNQTDWSIASNDSLFSIHTGNNSFSMGELMLPNYEQLIYPPELQPAATNNPFGLPITAEELEDEVEFGRKSSCMWEDFQEPTAAAAITEPPEIVVTEKEESPSERILLESSSNVSDARLSVSSARMSEESGNSCNSFAFPVLTSEAAAMNQYQGSPDSMGTGPPLRPTARREKQNSAGPGPVPEPKPTKESCGGPEAPPPENNSSWFSCFSCCTMKCHCCGRATCSKANTDQKLDT